MPTIHDVKESIRDRSIKALAVVEDPKRTMAEKKTELDVLEPEIKSLTEELKDLEHLEDARKRYQPFAAGDADGGAKALGQTPAPDTGGYAGQVKSLGAQFVESAEYKSIIAGGLKGSRWTTGDVDLKTLFAEGTTGAPGPGNAPVATPTVLPGITEIRLMPLTVADLFPQGTTDSPLIRYLVETAITNAAAATAEGGLKPESALTLSKVDEVLHKIATFLPITDEMLEDFAQARSYIDGRLELFVKQSEEAQLLLGDGTGSNLVGILNRAGLAAPVAKGVPVANASDNDMDAIYRQITAIRVTAFLEPDAIVTDPATWQTITLSKNSQGIYYAGGPFMNTLNPLLWGRKVVATPRMTANTALVGAFAMGGQIFRKGGLTVEASNSHADFFQRDQTAIRAYERLALAIYRPGAFGLVTGL